MLRESGLIKTKIIAIFVLAVNLIYNYLFGQGILNAVSTASSLSLLLLTAEIVNNIIKIPEELAQYETRYGSSFSKVFENALLPINWSTYLFTTISALTHIYLNGFTIKHWPDASTILIIFGLRAVANGYSLYDTDLNMRLNIEKTCLDYGAGMAYSFYHGYLKITLPDSGTEEKGLLEKIADYESQNNVYFRHKKLFVLIPTSGYCPPDLKELGPDWIEAGAPLEKLVRNVSGVQKRPYKHSVYKIKPPHLPTHFPTYIVMEGATPVKTFHEVTQLGFGCSEFYKRHEKEIIYRFYVTLKDILKNRPEGHLCVPVYYEDRDQDGNLLNVAKILLREYFDYEY